MSTPLALVAGAVHLRQVLRADGLPAEVVERQYDMTAARIVAWAAVAAGLLLMITVGASLAMLLRGRPFGDDPHKEGQ
jgi:hypothetical protein